MNSIQVLLRHMGDPVLFDSYQHTCEDCGLVRSIETEPRAFCRRADWVEEMFRRMGGGAYVPVPGTHALLKAVCGVCLAKQPEPEAKRRRRKAA